MHIGITSPIKRKLLPEIASFVSINSAQSLHYFIVNSNWSVEKLRNRRLHQRKKALWANAITVVIDENSLYGESSEFIRKFNEYKLAYVVATRSNHGVWLPPEQKVRANKWYKFERKFSNQKSETRYVREIVYGKRKAITYWEITTNP